MLTASRVGVHMVFCHSVQHEAVYDVLIGSYSAGIIRKSTLPVWVVPIRGS